jgi:hypothetical protein
VRLSALAKVVLLDGAIAKVEEPQAEAKFSAGGALNHVMTLKNHEEAVRRAFVQLERGSHLRESERCIAFSEQVKDCKCTIQGLNFVCSLGSGVSHYEPPCRKMVKLRFPDYAVPCQLLIRPYQNTIRHKAKCQLT